ncbi:MAG: ABC transporter substrate-binding protein, partial [Deltaproteobacteria bacterium]|nr:ABC transporter substrate-binding protein [Deltaproteobacteria bacterium]
MKKILLVMILSFLIACHQDVPRDKETIVIGIEDSPENFDPRLQRDALSQKINKLIYNGLLTKDDHLNLVPDLAVRHEMRDPQTYVFYLRDNCFFHNQKKLTSKDVKYTYQSMMGDEIISPYKSKLKVIKSIETPDDRTVIFKLGQTHTPFLSLMTLGILPEPNADALHKDLSGTGPYRLEPEKTTLSQVVLERFDGYFGPKAKNSRLVFRVINDSTLRALELIKGRIDLVQNNCPFVMIPFLKNKKDLLFKKDTGINFSYMAFNLKNEYLKNKKV